MAQIPLNQDEVVENIYATNVWRVPGISQFITKNILNLTRCYLTIVDTRLSNHPIVTRRLNESKTLSTLDHPSIYKIEIYQRKFSSAEILALKELYAEPDMPLFPPSKNSEDTDMEAICIKMEQPHNVSATGFVLTNHYRKDSPIFHQQQIVMIQNLVQVVNYLHKKVIPIRDLVAHALFSGESETNLNSPLVKVNVSLAAFPHVASIPLPDDNVKRSRYHEDIAKLSTLFKSILMYGMAYLHEKNILHRDLKPQNVFFASHENMFPVKIGDFGFSTSDFGLSCPTYNTIWEEDDYADRLGKLDLDSSHTANPGAAAYQAPEVKNEKSKKAKYGKQADIFSLGLIILEIVKLFKTKVERSVAFDKLVKHSDNTIISDELTLVQSTNVKSIIISMTKKDTTTRLTSMSQVLLVGPEAKVATSEQLRAACTLPSTIILSEGIYSGSFLLTSDCINIRGASPSTTIFQMEDDSSTESVITLTGNNCSISNLQIRCGLRNPGIEILGNHNKLDNIWVSKAITIPVKDYNDLNAQRILIQARADVPP
ncbi:Eukaryotic translation initiation factor 2-alpha kinase 4 [Folsomia candida]|uniref:Eukaryotic translation initiation factor 2-alpha kinase 4 n=1 Tax=Folsomia candida TaxID=158441 RepID=A0A226DHQ8_FOLCA|nr:Eukaryotic translation initiation factor 2-alpha kinase 4 [Folsomia candida]